MELPRPARPGLPVVMGVLNVTPDSFSDGGLHDDLASAVAHGHAMWADGADVLDVGGESTRPGATRPTPAEELDRVVPVVAALAAEGAVVSVDTMRAEVARAAVEAGASVVNDVSGGLADPDLLGVVAATGAAYVAMHWRGHSDHMADRAVYDGPGGVVADVRRELAARLEAVVAAGVDPGRVALDPGLGFAKDAEHNWEVLAGLGELAALGRPLLVGASRKTFLGRLLPDPVTGRPRPPREREAAGHALTVLLAQRGVWGVRVHDVRGTCDALAVWETLERYELRGTREAAR